MMSIGENIARLRKAKGWTQAELGEMLGVSNQAVSKWEAGMTMPDIMLLPALAEAFECSIDALFSMETCTGTQASFPWPDDDTIRVFLARGRRILKKQEGNTCLEVIFPRECNETTRQYFKVEVLGNLMCDSSINGDVVCHGRMDCHVINGDVKAEGNVNAFQINSCGVVSGNNIAGGK